MLIETKSSAKAFQRSVKQLYDGKERLAEMFSALGLETKWKYVGVFITMSGNQLFDCKNCSNFFIIGEESILPQFQIIEEKIAILQQNWNPTEHVKEFVDLAKLVLFVVQGDAHAPVTESNIIDKIVEHVERASNPLKISFWTSEQLSIIQALDIPYLLLDAFYSTGKSRILGYYGKDKLKKGGILHYFINRSVWMKDSTKLPFTLMLEDEFPLGVVKETNFEFGMDSVKGFLMEYGVEQDHHLIFDEVICTKYTKGFVDSLIAMKNNVASMWIAMGTQPGTGE